MGKRYFHAVTDPAFAAFVYYHMKHITPEVRAKLNPEERAYFRDERTMRKFANNNTLERRILMLTRIGVSWNMTFFTGKTDLDLAMKEIDEDYSYAEKMADLTRMMKHGELFSFGSRTLTAMSGLAEQGSHSQTYTLDYSYLGMQRAMASTRHLKYDLKIQDADATYADLAKLMFYTIHGFRELTDKEGLSQVQLRVLLIMLGYKNSFISLRMLKSKMGYPIESKILYPVVKVMIRKQLMYTINVPDHDWDSKGYTITEIGIEKAMAFVKYIWQWMNHLN